MPTPEPSTKSWPPCDICGKPATHATQDEYRDASPHLGGRIQRTAVPHSIRVRCDEHHTESQEYDISSLELMSMSGFREEDYED